MSAKEAIVTNTGPLIALSLVERLDILHALYEPVLVPAPVHAEMLHGGKTAQGVQAYSRAVWLNVQSLIAEVEPLLQATLDAGEASVIQLARERAIPLVLIDERKGRKIARAVYDLRVIGTAGILLQAKRQGLISQVAPLLFNMREAGYRMHDAIIAFALKEADEFTGA